MSLSKKKLIGSHTFLLLFHLLISSVSGPTRQLAVNLTYFVFLKGRRNWVKCIGLQFMYEIKLYTKAAWEMFQIENNLF